MGRSPRRIHGEYGFRRFTTTTMMAQMMPMTPV
jgi:hypothetical protein